MTIIEAIPNVSEGRRQKVVDRLVDAVRDVPGSRLLDYSADPSHNRTVMTLVGDADGLTTALLRLYDVATQQIDLGTHRGEHPRIGAVDVVPFVALQETSTDDCVSLARALGQTVAAQFAVPVYLYADAATRPERRALESIRRGQLSGLASRMVEEAWHPDFGPHAPHPTAGVSVIGVRGPLIAFNINLDTEDLEIAQQIARTIREQSGGLPFVKAIGIELTDRPSVQVSMNLTNPEHSPIDRAFELVTREAAKRGVGIASSQIVGLVSASTLIATAARHLQLGTFTQDQVLEARLCPRMSLPPRRSSSQE